MNPNQMQPRMAPNDAAASLALATHLSTQLAAPQDPQQPQNAPQEPSPEVQALTQQVETLATQVQQLTKKVAQDPQEDIAMMKQMIEQALAEDDKQDGK